MAKSNIIEIDHGTLAQLEKLASIMRPTGPALALSSDFNGDRPAPVRAKGITFSVES